MKRTLFFILLVALLCATTTTWAQTWLGSGNSADPYLLKSSNELGVWMCDRFSRNLTGHVTANPNGTYRDLYLYCVQHTLGSHVGIYNYQHFGNLYTTSPKDFFVKSR